MSAAERVHGSTPQVLQHAVAAAIAELRSALGETALVPMLRGSLDILDILREPLILDGGQEKRDTPGWRERLYSLKKSLELLRTRRPGVGRMADVLAVPRTPGHFADMIPVCKALERKHGLKVLVATYGASVDTLPFVDLLRLRGARSLSLWAGAAGRGDRMLAAARAPLLQLLERVLPTLPRLLFVAGALDELLGVTRPRLVLAGNPNAPDGRIAARLAQTWGIPCAAIEHGTINDEDPCFEGCPVDLFCAWGEVSAAALAANGLKSDRIAITGAPRLDEVIAAQRTTDARVVLVATSGPGHMTNLEQHRRFVDLLYQAAARLPDLRFVVKLHLKDSMSHYRQAPNVEVVPPSRERFGRDIYEWLGRSSALITVASTTALDAMALDVPVVTVDVGQRRGLAYLDERVTTHVRTAAELADALSAPPSAEAIASQRAYRARHFHHLGGASAETARRLVELMA